MPAVLRTLNKAEQEYEKAMDDLSKQEFKIWAWIKIGKGEYGKSD